MVEHIRRRHASCLRLFVRGEGEGPRGEGSGKGSETATERRQKDLFRVSISKLVKARYNVLCKNMVHPLGEESDLGLLFSKHT